MADDRVLVESTLRGEMEAFTQLVRKYQSPLVTAAYHLLHHVEDAQDLAQEALLEAYRQLRQLRDREKFRPWLFAILRYKCRRYLRHCRSAALSLDECAEIPAMPYVPADEEIARVFHRLPAADREVLTARYLNELEYDEIAQILGCSVPTAYVRCKRARERLRTLLLQGDEEETRRTLQRATSVLTISLTGDGLVERVLQGVRPMPALPPTALPKPPIPHLQAMLPVAGWKVAAGLAALLVIAGVGSFFLPVAHQAAARPALPMATPLRAENVVLPMEHTAASPALHSLLPADTPAPLLIAAVPSQPAAMATAPYPAGRPAMAFQIGDNDRTQQLAVSPDGAWIAALGVNDVIIIWDVKTGLIAGRLTQFSQAYYILFLDDNRSLLIIQHAHTPTIWDLAAWRGRPMPMAARNAGWILPDGKRWRQEKCISDASVPFGQKQFEITLSDVATGAVLSTSPPLTGASIADTPDDLKHATEIYTYNKATTRYDDVQIIIWDFLTGKEISHLRGLSDIATSHCFSRDGSIFAATAWNSSSVLLWDTQTGKLLHTLTGQPGNLSSLAMSADGTRLATRTNGELNVWDVQSGKSLPQIARLAVSSDSMLFTPNGTQLIMQSGNAIQLLDIASGRITCTLSTPMQPLLPGAPDTLAATREGNLLATLIDRGGFYPSETIALWDLRTGRIRREIPLPPAKSCMDHTYGLHFSPDGRLLLTTSVQNWPGYADFHSLITIYDVNTGAVKRSFQSDLAIGDYGSSMSPRSDSVRFASDTRMNNAAFSPDGTLLAIGATDGSLLLWDTREWTNVKRLPGQPGIVDDIAFSADGSTLAWLTAAPPDKKMHSRLTLWNIPGDRRITREAGEDYRFDHLCFSPDGRRVAVRRESGSFGDEVKTPSTVCCWDTASGKPCGPFLPPAEHKYIQQLAFSPDSTHLLGESDGDFFCYELTTGKSTAVPMASGLAREMLLCTDGNALITQDFANSIKLWDPRPLNTGAAPTERATLYTFDQDTWLATTPEGYYDCSPAMTHVFDWNYQGRLYPYAQFAAQYHRPDLLQHVLNETPASPTRLAVMPTPVCYAERGLVAAVQEEPAAVEAAPLPTGRPQMSFLLDHALPINLLAVSPDGARYATAGDDEITIWNMNTGLPEDRLAEFHWIRSLRFSADGRSLLIGEYQQNTDSHSLDIIEYPNITVAWNIADRRRLPISPALQGHADLSCPLPDGKQVWQLAFSDGGYRYAPQCQVAATLYDVRNGGVLCQTRLNGQYLAMAPDGAKLATLTGIEKMVPYKLNPQAVTPQLTDAQIIIWDPRSGRELSRLRGLRDLPGAVSFSPDGNTLAVSAARHSYDDTAQSFALWDTRTGELRHASTEHSDKVFTHLEFSADSTRLATDTPDHVVLVWDVQSGDIVQQVTPQTYSPLLAISFTPDGRQLLMLPQPALSKRSIQLLDIASGEINSTPAPLRQVQRLAALATTRDGRLLAADVGGTLVLWDLRKKAVLHALPAPCENFSVISAISLHFSPDGRLLLAVVGRSVAVYDVHTGVLISSHTISELPARWEFSKWQNFRMHNTVFNPDGTLLATCTHDKSVLLWDTREWKILKGITELPGMAYDIAFSPDGTKLAWLCARAPERDTTGHFICGNDQLTLWDIPSDRRITQDAGAGYSFSHLCFSPDGRRLASRREYCQGAIGRHTPSAVLCWDTASGEPSATLLPQADHQFIQFFAFSPENTRLIGESDGYLFRWDLASGKLTTRQKVSATLLGEMLLSADGDTLITADSDNAIKLWDTRRLFSGAAPQPRATLYTFDKDTWLAVTPQGYFDCSPAMTSTFNWRYQGRLYPYDKFAAQYHRPESVGEALAK